MGSRCALESELLAAPQADQRSCCALETPVRAAARAGIAERDSVFAYGVECVGGEVTGHRAARMCMLTMLRLVGFKSWLTGHGSYGGIHTNPKAQGTSNKQEAQDIACITSSAPSSSWLHT